MRSRVSLIGVVQISGSISQLTNSPKKDLVIFTKKEGGIEHSSLDNPLNAGATIADWFAEQLHGKIN